MTKSRTATEYCQESLRGVKSKADHNKKEALLAFTVTIGATLAAPLFITLGDGFLTGKVIPSVLSLLAAACTAWLQLRRPQQLWGLYRTAQRELEDQAARHEFRLGEYQNAADPDSLLAEHVASICWDLHKKWMPMIPNTEHLGAPSAGGIASASSRLPAGEQA